MGVSFQIMIFFRNKDSLTKNHHNYKSLENYVLKIYIWNVLTSIMNWKQYQSDAFWFKNKKLNKYNFFRHLIFWLIFKRMLWFHSFIVKWANIGHRSKKKTFIQIFDERKVFHFLLLHTLLCIFISNNFAI